MTLHRHVLPTAWLGLIAMWLVVFAPVVSQLVIASRAQEPIAALCSVTIQPDTTHHHDPSSNPLSACGYCDLLATHTAVPSVPPAIVQVLTLVTVIAVPALSVRFTPLGAFPSGRPRGPPSFS